MSKKRVNLSSKGKRKEKACQECGAKPALRRHWNGKVLCNACAAESLDKFLKTLGIALVVIAIGIAVL